MALSQHPSGSVAHQRVRLVMIRQLGECLPRSHPR